MARIIMEEIVEALDKNFARVLKAVVDEAAPGNTADEKTIMRIFHDQLYHCQSWKSDGRNLQCGGTEG